MNPIYVAIDTPLRDVATATVKLVAPHVGGYKIGLEYFCEHGPSGVMDLFAASGLPVFLDLKFHDIPQTVSRAIKRVCGHLPSHPPAILTVHAAGGLAMLRAARDAAPPETKVVAVTVLTSLDENDLRDQGIGHSTDDHARNLAWMAMQAGLDGIVCSGHDVEWIKGDFWPEGFMVVPGIRPAGADEGDQKRVVTPKLAMDRGADVLVIGRPITGTVDPAQAAQQIMESLK
jgi:orotidine-5'-phosphate decarboxylase